MKKVLFLFLSVAVFPVIAQDTDGIAVSMVSSRLQQLPDELSAYAESLAVDKKEINNEVLEGAIIGFLKPLATDDFIKEWKALIDNRLTHKYQLAYRDDYDWALPPVQRLTAVRKNGETVIICRGEIGVLYLLMEKTKGGWKISDFKKNVQL
jgi:hypothetical protein